MNAMLNFARLNFPSFGFTGKSPDNMYRNILITMLKKLQGGRLAIFEDGAPSRAAARWTSPVSASAMAAMQTSL